jgi:hypothetical protein
MPYFIICPIYAVLFVGLLFVSCVLLFIKPLRRWSSYLAVGAVGTLPGFILGNVIFWLVTWGLLTIAHKPLQQLSSDIANGVAAVVVVVFFVGGLAIANIGGCVVGFFGGVWLRAKLRRTNAG